MKLRRWIAVICMTGALATAHASEEHGKTDVFTAPGVALAWAVSRGADEARTFVVIRVAADPARFASLSVIGRDPFTQAERTWMAPTPIKDGRIDIRIPRPGFADHPRTSVRFHAPAAAANAQPALEVYYLGVPDTTPEFNDPEKLDAYLEERVRMQSSHPPLPRRTRVGGCPISLLA